MFCTELASSIVPSTQEDLSLLPNFVLAAKDPNRLLAAARRQACHDSALGARGMASLRQYNRDEPRYGTAYTILCIYHSGQLKVYTTHFEPPSSLHSVAWLRSTRE